MRKEAKRATGPTCTTRPRKFSADYLARACVPIADSCLGSASALRELALFLPMEHLTTCSQNSSTGGRTSVDHLRTCNRQKPNHTRRILRFPVPSAPLCGTKSLVTSSSWRA